MTFKEIEIFKNDLNKDIINLFEKTYFWEFNFENDDLDLRKEIIDVAISYINKK
jgi:hypothetical protein